MGFNVNIMDFVVEGLKWVKIKIRLKLLHKECGQKLFVEFMMWKIVLDVKYNLWVGLILLRLPLIQYIWSSCNSNINTGILYKIGFYLSTYLDDIENY